MTFNKALELYNNQQFIAAQSLFSSVKKNSEDESIQGDCAYYIANCAVRLNQQNADTLMEEFVSEYPLSVYPSWAKYGNNYFKNSLIKTDWKIIDKINFNLHKDSIVNIIASSYNPHFYNISKMNNIEYKIYHNHEQLYSTNYPSFDFISKYHFNKGAHLLTLMAKTNDVACLCPTIGDGFKSGHHFAIWENTIENKRNNIPIKITLPIYHKENNVIKIDNFNVGVKYNLNLFTK